MSCVAEDELPAMTVRCFGWDQPLGDNDPDQDPYQVGRQQRVQRRKRGAAVSIITGRRLAIAAAHDVLLVAWVLQIRLSVLPLNDDRHFKASKVISPNEVRAESSL